MPSWHPLTAHCGHHRWTLLSSTGRLGLCLPLPSSLILKTLPGASNWLHDHVRAVCRWVDGMPSPLRLPRWEVGLSLPLRLTKWRIITKEEEELEFRAGTNKWESKTSCKAAICDYLHKTLRGRKKIDRYMQLWSRYSSVQNMLLMNKTGPTWLSCFGSSEFPIPGRMQEKAGDQLVKVFLCNNKFLVLNHLVIGNSLVVPWLGISAFTAADQGLIPGRGIKIPQGSWHGQKKKKKKII